MKTAVSIPDELFTKADALAAELGVSRSELYAKALAEFVSSKGADEVTARLNRVYGDQGTRDADPAWKARNRGVLLKSDW